MRKHIWLLMVITVLLRIPLGYAGEIKGAGAGSCGEWVEDRKRGSYWGQLHWVMGFISSYNFFVYKGSLPNGVFGNADSNAIAVWLDTYCQKNPLNTPAHGAVALIEELRSRAGE